MTGRTWKGLTDEVCSHCGHYVDWHQAESLVADDERWDPSMSQPYRCTACGCLVVVEDRALVFVGDDAPDDEFEVNDRLGPIDGGKSDE